MEILHLLKEYSKKSITFNRLFKWTRILCGTIIGLAVIFMGYSYLFSVPQNWQLLTAITSGDEAKLKALISKHQYGWDTDAVHLFEKGLGLLTVQNDSAALGLQRTCPQAGGNENLITTFVATKKVANIWQYLSLVAAVHMEPLSFDETRVFLPDAVIQDVESLFVESLFRRLSTLPRHCIHLERTVLFGDTDVSEQLLSEKNSFFILESDAKMVFELSSSDWSRLLKRHESNNPIRFHPALVREALQMRKTVLDRFQKPDKWRGSDLSLIGLYVEDDQLPIDYYQMAMKIHLDNSSLSRFMIICPAWRIKYCQKTFGKQATAVIVRAKQNSMANVVLLTTTAGIIVSNELSLMGAILNESGRVIVYRNGSRDEQGESRFPFLLAAQRSNWLIIERIGERVDNNR